MVDIFYQDHNATKNSVSLKQWRAHTREEPYPCEQCNNQFNDLKALKSTYRKETIPLWTMQTWNHWVGSTFHALNVGRGLHKQEDLNYMREFTLKKSHFLVPHATRDLDEKEDFNFKWEPTLGKECQHALREQVICLCWGVWNAETIYML